MYQRILVGLDGSPSAEQALGAAAAIAHRAQAEIKLIHVLDPVQSRFAEAPARDAWTSDYPHRDAREYLERLGRVLNIRWKTRVTIEVMNGDAAKQLVKAADRPRSDLLVLASHGRGPLERFWLGSVADRVMREASPPVLLVPVSAGAQGRERFTNILAPLDGSELAEHSLYDAATLADLFGARLSLLRIVEVAPQVVAVPAGVGVFPVSMVETATLEQAASRYLDDVASTYKFLAPIITTEVLVDATSVAGSILDYVAAHNVDLVAIATHGDGGIKRLVLGSVADKLIRAGRVAVLVHKSQGVGTIQKGSHYENERAVAP